MRNYFILLALTLAACEAAPSPQPAPAPPAAPPPTGLTRLIGKPPEAVIALLGKPSLDRIEGPARQLQFIRPPCVLDVFLYPVPGGSLAARTAAARRPDGTRIDAGTCLGLIAPPG